jgi:putative ATP-grasp target RiPP
MIINDLIRYGDHFPLGSPMKATNDSDTEVAPFGLRYSTMPNTTLAPDFTKISYDSGTQTAIFTEEDGSIIQAGRHTSTQTTTDTASQDRKPGQDKDTDATGD